MTLDALLQSAWTADEVASLDAWRQGHLVKGSLGAWLVADDGQSDEFEAASVPISDTGYFAVVSQTCDVGGLAPGDRHPLVQICPVRDVSVFGETKVEQIQNGDVVEYVWLTKPPVAGAQWAVDLRATFPLSKRALTVAAPVTGFASYEDEIGLGARLALKTARPALHDYLTDTVVRGLNDLLGKAKKSKRWVDDVEQFRFEVIGDPLQPTAVRLVVLTREKMDTRDRDPLRVFWKSHKAGMLDVGISQMRITFMNVSRMSVERYRRMIPIRLSKFDEEIYA